MKTLHLILIFSILSLIIMIFVDYIIGPNAEFLNAFTAVQRLFGVQPTFGDSMIATRFGAIGELGIVFIVNTIIGSTITIILRSFTRS